MKPKHLLVIGVVAIVLAGIAVVATATPTPTGDIACTQARSAFQAALSADANNNQTPVVNPETGYWDFTQSPGPGLDPIYPKYENTKSTQWAFSFDATGHVTKVVFRSDNRPDPACGV